MLRVWTHFMCVHFSDKFVVFASCVILCRVKGGFPSTNLYGPGVPPSSLVIPSGCPLVSGARAGSSSKTQPQSGSSGREAPRLRTQPGDNQTSICYVEVATQELEHPPPPSSSSSVLASTHCQLPMAFFASRQLCGTAVAAGATEETLCTFHLRNLSSATWVLIFACGQSQNRLFSTKKIRL